MIFQNSLNFLNQNIDGELNSEELRENYTKILSVLLPIIPHYASECLNDLNDNIFQNWPQIDKKMLQEDYVEYVVQINGKKRAMIKTKKDISQEELISKIKSSDLISEVAELIPNKVSLEKADWEIIIQIMGETTCIGILPKNSIISVSKEKRLSSYQQ